MVFYKAYWIDVTQPGLYGKYFAFEKFAYETQSLVNRAFGTNSASGVWNTSWANLDKHQAQYQRAIKEAADRSAAADYRASAPLQ